MAAAVITDERGHTVLRGGITGRVLEEVFLDCYFTWPGQYGSLEVGYIT